MTFDEAVEWLRRAGIVVRLHGRLIEAGYGTAKVGDVHLYAASASIAQQPGETDWTVVSHGRVGTFDDIADAVVALRDYVVDLAGHDSPKPR